MAIVVVLVPADFGEDGLGASSLRRLGELGVTNVSVVRDDTTVGVVLEGWAFDPARSGHEAASLIGGASAGRTLLPVMQGAVTPPMREQTTEITRTCAWQRKEQS